MTRDRGKFILASKTLFFSAIPGSEIFDYALTNPIFQNSIIPYVANDMLINLFFGINLTCL
jgi:hypothetical protein